MKKVFKSRILLVIVTVILTGSISVYAAGKYYAKDIEYTPKNSSFNVDNLADALDALYTKVKPEYTGVTEVTPSQSSQTLNTKDKALTKNITINPIPNTYKNLTTQTNATASDILSGKTAYTSDGTLVTGNISTNCIKGNIIIKAQNKQLVENKFAPSFFSVWVNNEWVNVYSKDYNDSIYVGGNKTDHYSGEINNIYMIENNSLYIGSEFNRSIYIGKTLYYVACK